MGNYFTKRKLFALMFDVGLEQESLKVESESRLLENGHTLWSAKVSYINSDNTCIVFKDGNKFASRQDAEQYTMQLVIAHLEIRKAYNLLMQNTTVYDCKESLQTPK